LNAIRVLHITGNLGMGGLERVISHICLNINKEIFMPAVCCLHFKGFFSTELEENKVPVYLLPQTKKTDYTAFLKLRDIINRFRPHIVHTHNMNAMIDGIIAAVIAKTPIRIHTDHGRNFPDKTRYMVIEWFLSHFMTKIVAVSDETRKNLIRYEHIKADKIAIINNGVANGSLLQSYELKKKHADLEINGFRHIVGVVGRLEKEKGPQYFLQAIPLILAKYPETCFVFAGQGSMLEELKAESIRLKVGHAVKFLGPRQDVPEILRLLDVYVLPSEREGLPLSLLEAMAAECPIVASNVGGVPNALENGKAGILAIPKSPEDLAGHICDLLANPSIRTRIGSAARKRFDEHFTVGSMTRSYEKLYLDLLQKKGFSI
jgi:glycosyltransferase involved in cell wall biosynthesis